MYKSFLTFNDGFLLLKAFNFLISKYIIHKIIHFYKNKISKKTHEKNSHKVYVCTLKQ